MLCGAWPSVGRVAPVFCTVVSALGPDLHAATGRGGRTAVSSAVGTNRNRNRRRLKALPPTVRSPAHLSQLCKFAGRRPVVLSFLVGLLTARLRSRVKICLNICWFLQRRYHAQVCRPASQAINRVKAPAGSASRALKRTPNPPPRRRPSAPSSPIPAPPTVRQVPRHRSFVLLSPKNVCPGLLTPSPTPPQLGPCVMRTKE